MLNLHHRTSQDQMMVILNLFDEHDKDHLFIIHRMRHNLDGLWVNISYTDKDGDWICSIDREGNLERTQ